VVVPLRPGSDGDPSHAPSNPAYKQYDPPTLYLEKLAIEWMKSRGESKPGVTYILERLPHGYTVYEKARASGKHIDRWVYGHPENKTFDSPNRFYPHFEHLMNNAGSSFGCPCSICVKNGVLHRPTTTSSASSRRSSMSGNSSKSVSGKDTRAPTKRPDPASAPAPASSAAAPQFKGRPKMIAPGMDTSRIDEEGTPDIWRNLIDKLKRQITLDQSIEEPMSMDWRAEQILLEDLLGKNEPQYAPRVGEIVLYLRNNTNGHHVDVIKDADSGEFRLYDPSTDSQLGAPQWAAGHVTQLPEPSNDEDGETSIINSGVRVEPLPNPNNGNKNMSKKYQYVPVSHTRPFFLWKYYLDVIDDDEWHPTITNALTCMSTMSVVGRHRFQGQWPKASIWCHAMYVGAELLMVGDTVRMSPKAGYPECTDILVIKSIRMKLTNLDKTSFNDYDDGHPYNTEAWIYGSAYTMDSSRSNKLYLDHKNADTPKATDGYSKIWHPLHPSNKEMAVPFSRILGRVYEYDFMHYLAPPASLDQGRESITEGRKFARSHDNRILKSPGSTWFWGDCRVQALDLETVNGLEVGKYDTERDPKELRKAIKVID
ncbi:hypothetical protein DM02DRAFT_496486, partial [Periconia macrospinosa]